MFLETIHDMLAAADRFSDKISGKPKKNVKAPLNTNFPDYLFEGNVHTKNKLIGPGLFPTKLVLTRTRLFAFLRISPSHYIPVSNISLIWKSVRLHSSKSDTDEFGFQIVRGKIIHDFYTDSLQLAEDWVERLRAYTICENFQEDFEPVKDIGCGNYAQVQLVRQKSTQTLYAAKILDYETILKDQRSFEQSIYEIEALRHLNNASITNLHYIYASSRKLYLVLDYVPYGTLFNSIITEGKYNEPEASQFILNLIKAVKNLHQNKISHRDLKPENILLSDENDRTQLKIADFGLACFYDKIILESCGSPGYIAPEILKQMPYSQKCDVFSIGVICYIMQPIFRLSGRAPFHSDTIDQTLLLNKECNIIFEDQYWQNISDEAKSFVLKLMKSDPNQRLDLNQASKHKWILQHKPRRSLIGHLKLQPIGSFPPGNFSRDSIFSKRRLVKRNLASLNLEKIMEGPPVNVSIKGDPNKKPYKSRHASKQRLQQRIERVSQSRLRSTINDASEPKLPSINRSFAQQKFLNTSTPSLRNVSKRIIQKNLSFQDKTPKNSQSFLRKSWAKA